MTAEDLQAYLDEHDYRCPVCESKTRALPTQMPTEHFRIGEPQTPKMRRDALLVECTDEDCNWANEVSEREGAQA